MSDEDGWSALAERVLAGHGHRHPRRQGGARRSIAAAVAYLASDDASFVTGLELYVDGGSVAR